MKKILATLLFLLIGLVTSRAQKTTDHGRTFHQVAFVDANIVDVEQGRILKTRTVYIENGIIREIQETKSAKLPQGTFRIDGKKKYLIPGLADMHIHHLAQGAFGSGSEPLLYDEKDLLLYLVNGVTTVRNMAGSEFILKLKSMLSRGEIIGPHYYSSGPPLVTGKRGFTVNSPQQIAAAIAEQKQAGFDFFKVYCCFTKEN